MEFFEFDNSFIGGYGDQQTSLKGDDIGAVKGTNNKLHVTCKMADKYKSNNGTIYGTPYGDISCKDDMPYQVKSGKGAGALGQKKCDGVINTKAKF